MKRKIITGTILSLGAVALVALAAILTPLIYALGGFFTGWVLAQVFPVAGQWVVSGAGYLGVEISREALPMLGAFLGFVGAFFKSTQTNKNKSN